MSAMRGGFVLLCLCLIVVHLHAKRQNNDDCSCPLIHRPDRSEKVRTARWMVHSLDWGVLSTISTLNNNSDEMMPFGNIYSFVDGPCENATGIPFFYGTYLDQSFQDTLSHPQVSLALSEASLCSKDALPACQLNTQYGDPESPVCARVTLMGTMVVLNEGNDEFKMVQQALFERHPSMATWPKNHNWLIAKIDIQQVWLIDFYGGPTILTPEEYFGASLEEDGVTS